MEMFGGKNLSFGKKVKERMQNAQQELSASWKQMADKAKKEVKIANRKARKALATEDGGNLREDYVLTVNLDAGHHLFKRFQESWVVMHDRSIRNVKKAEEVEVNINSYVKQWQMWNEYLSEFHGNLVVLPDVIAKVEIAQKRLEAIGKQTQKIEELILEYEDACERWQFEKQKDELKVKLSELVETKQAEYTLKKSMISSRNNSSADIVEAQSSQPTTPVHNRKELERQKSAEKQKAYGDAFLDQMNQYIQYGELEKPIAGTVGEHNTSIDDIQIDDSDLSTLREFLGPEELNSVLQAQASQNKAMKKSASTDSLDNNKTQTHPAAIITSPSTDVTSIDTAVTHSNNTEVPSGIDNTYEVPDSKEDDITENVIPVVTKKLHKPSEGSDDDAEFFDAASDNDEL